MSLHARVSRLDDYAGELTQALSKLQIELSRGVLDRKQQEDFLADLGKAVELHDLRPMRRRGALDLLIAALTAVVAILLARILPPLHPLMLGLFALGAAGLALAVWRMRLYQRRLHHDRSWLKQLETRVAAGGTIFD